MRKISLIIIHCTGTEADPHLGAAAIDSYHKSIGWCCIGYHYLIRTDGKIEEGRVLEKEGAHTLHHNKESIGIAYVGGTIGGKNIDSRTPAQKKSLEQLVKSLLVKFPEAKVAGHHDFNPSKDCPCFDVKTWCESIGINRCHIYGL